jgi:hypothetical protein
MGNIRGSVHVGPVIALLVFVFIIVFIVMAIIAGIKNTKRMKVRVSEMGANDFFSALHFEGLDISQNTMCELYSFKDKILIDAKSQKFEIKYENLKVAVVKSEQEIIEKGKSVVGRAVLGTLLLPGLGTIIGGISGVGTKKKGGQTNHYLILNYTDSRGDMSAVTFKNNLNIIKMNKFCNEINKSSSYLKPEVIQL